MKQKKHIHYGRAPLYDKCWANNFCKIAITLTSCLLAVGVFIASILIDESHLYIDVIRSILTLLGGQAYRIFK